MTDHERGILTSTMSDASAAMILGWSVARVKRARARTALTRADCAAAVAAFVRANPDLAAEPAPPPPVPPNPPLPANVTRWVRAFDRAGWPLLEIARLFDLDPDQLAEAL